MSVCHFCFGPIWIGRKLFSLPVVKNNPHFPILSLFKVSTTGKIITGNIPFFCGTRLQNIWTITFWPNSHHRQKLKMICRIYIYGNVSPLLLFCLRFPKVIYADVQRDARCLHWFNAWSEVNVLDGTLVDTRWLVREAIGVISKSFLWFLETYSHRQHIFLFGVDSVHVSVNEIKTFSDNNNFRYIKICCVQKVL